jgi:hypothetical protein
MNIQIEFTEQRASYQNEYYKPIICKIDKELPKINNGGYNNYSFAENVNWEIKGIEPYSHDGKEARRIKQWVYLSESIEVHTPSGKIVGLQYYKTIDIIENKICTFFIAP